MATRNDRIVLDPLRTLFSVGSIGNLTDGQLLERFATGRGEAAELAFAALVERHGPMVLRVCRSVLAGPHDAEDAFQATFLVLVKKARGLWVNDSLGAWLHQVAFRTASSALKDAIRRQRHERIAAEQAAASSHRDQGDQTEMEALLHAEIDRLPERYRVPIVLCDLEGLSYEQAARHLGWPIGTVKSRLARGRDRLRDRIQRRGLFPGLESIALAIRPIGLDHAIPNTLVQSTTIAAVRFAASQSIASVSAAALAQGVLNAMSITRWVKFAAVLLVAGATVSGGGLMSRMFASGVEPGTQKSVQARSGSDVPIAQVNRGKFKLTVAGPGTLEPVRRSTLLCRVEGRTTIISILPEGTKVKKGDLVCELDSALLRDQLTNQRVATQTAEASFQQVKLSRENAELAVKEYEEGTYLLEKSTIEGEIKVAESAIEKAKAQLERTRRFRQRLNDTQSRKEAVAGAGDLLAELSLENQMDAAEQTLLREQVALEHTRGRLNLLVNYTKGRTSALLRSNVAERRSAELAKEQAFQLERSKERNLISNIEQYKLYAPGDGVIVHANDPSRTGGPPQIAEGATVRERQILLWIDDLQGPMQVNAKMPESMVDREQVGQKVLIKVDAFPAEVFSGKVFDVAPLPDPTSFFNANIKVYTTYIRFDEISPKLRPRMNARVEILLADRDNALLVPASAVIELDGKDRVAVKKSTGGFDWRDVAVGDANGTEFEITEGIKPGEQVATDPARLLSEEERGRYAPARSAYIKKVMEEQLRGKTARKNVSSPVAQKLRNLSAEDRARFKTASPKEREAILKKAGFTDEELREIEERAKQFRIPKRPE